MRIVSATSLPRRRRVFITHHKNKAEIKQNFYATGEAAAKATKLLKRFLQHSYLR
jgi:hypothetical protein